MGNRSGSCVCRRTTAVPMLSPNPSPRKRPRPTVTEQTPPNNTPNNRHPRSLPFLLAPGHRRPEGHVPPARFELRPVRVWGLLPPREQGLRVHRHPHRPARADYGKWLSCFHLLSGRPSLIRGRVPSALNNPPIHRPTAPHLGRDDAEPKEPGAAQRGGADEGRADRGGRARHGPQEE